MARHADAFVLPVGHGTCRDVLPFASELFSAVAARTTLRSRFHARAPNLQTEALFWAKWEPMDVGVSGRTCF